MNAQAPKVAVTLVLALCVTVCQGEKVREGGFYDFTGRFKSHRFVVSSVKNDQIGVHNVGDK